MTHYVLKHCYMKIMYSLGSILRKSGIYIEWKYIKNNATSDSMYNQVFVIKMQIIEATNYSYTSVYLNMVSSSCRHLDIVHYRLKAAPCKIKPHTSRHSHRYTLCQGPLQNGYPSETHFIPLWPSDAIWWRRIGSRLVQVMACCLMTPRHLLSQCWLIISEVLWHSPDDSFRGEKLRVSIPDT